MVQAKIIITVRMHRDVKEAAAKAAAAENRNLTNLIEHLLVEHCKQSGTLPKDWIPK